MTDVPLLSTGQPSTLRVWRDLSGAVFGDDSPQAQFLDEKIAMQGEDEPVVADERQMLLLLVNMVEVNLSDDPHRS